MSCDVSSSSSGQDETVGQSLDWWGCKTLAIITGANRGFGKAIAIRLAKRFHRFHNITPDQDAPHPAKISFLLLARDTTGLGQVATELQETGPAVLRVQPVSVHLNEATSLTAFDNVLENESLDYDQVLLVHNAGTLNNPNQTVEHYRPSGIAELDEYMRINFTSAILLTASFLRKYKYCHKRTIINITSLSAIEPMKGLALYGSVKAARDQYFKSVAIEDPNCRILNYAPGPMKTEMANILATQGYLKEFFSNRQNLLDPADSAERMIRILEEDNYDNGAHIDFYDPMP